MSLLYTGFRQWKWALINVAEELTWTANGGAVSVVKQLLDGGR